MPPFSTEIALAVTSPSSAPFFLNRHGLGNDLSGHSSLDFDASRLKPSKAMNIGLALYDDMPRADPPRNFPCEVDRRGIVAMQIAPKSALN